MANHTRGKNNFATVQRVDDLDGFPFLKYYGESEGCGTAAERHVA